MKARLSQQDVPQDAIALDIAFLDNSHSKSISSRTTKAVTKRKENTKLPVRTEFVFTSHIDYKSVSLCGDWCNWQPIQMKLEQGKCEAPNLRSLHLTPRETKAERVWSVITVTPSGYREFCYVADGRLTVSPKHPTNLEGTRNWRMVYGPPASRRPQVGRLSWLEKRMDKLADSVRAALISTFRTEGKKQRGITIEGDVEDGITSASTSGKQSCSRVCRGWGRLKVVLVCFVLSGVIIGILRVRQVLR